MGASLTAGALTTKRKSGQGLSDEVAFKGNSYWNPSEFRVTGRTAQRMTLHYPVGKVAEAQAVRAKFHAVI